MRWRPKYAVPANGARATTITKGDRMTPTPTGWVIPTAIGRDLVLERVLPGSIDDAWASITDSDRLARWFCTWTGEPRVEATLELTLVAEEGDATSQAEVLEFGLRPASACNGADQKDVGHGRFVGAAGPFRIDHRRGERNRCCNRAPARRTGRAVQIADLDLAGAQAVAAETRGEAWQLDLSDPTALSGIQLEVDILVNNAGVQRVSPSRTWIRTCSTGC